jgi:hypothetical protein
MEATQTAAPLSFETVWAALMENREQLKELAESQKETDRIQKETALEIKETNRQIKEYNKRFGDFTNRFGEVVEYMIAPNLQEKFGELGLSFHRTNKNTKVLDFGNNIFFEIDFLLENGDKAMLVEVKTKLTTEHVQEHIERIGKMRKYADLWGDRRAFLGAVAGAAMEPNVKEYALKQGLFVVEPSGETFNITPPSGQPKEW